MWKKYDHSGASLFLPLWHAASSYSISICKHNIKLRFSRDNPNKMQRLCTSIFMGSASSWLQPAEQRVVFFLDHFSLHIYESKLQSNDFYLIKCWKFIHFQTIFTSFSHKTPLPETFVNSQCPILMYPINISKILRKSLFFSVWKWKTVSFWHEASI